MRQPDHAMPTYPTNDLRTRSSTVRAPDARDRYGPGKQHAATDSRSAIEYNSAFESGRLAQHIKISDSRTGVCNIRVSLCWSNSTSGVCYCPSESIHHANFRAVRDDGTVIENLEFHVRRKPTCVMCACTGASGQIPRAAIDVPNPIRILSERAIAVKWHSMARLTALIVMCNGIPDTVDLRFRRCICTAFIAT